MQSLKLLVIGMGVFILIATAALVTVIVQRAGKLAPVQAQETPISVPDGFHIVSSEISGDRLLVRLDGQDETRLIVVDLAHGDAQHTVRLTLPGEGP
jgi:hypothetical protein